MFLKEFLRDAVQTHDSDLKCVFNFYEQSFANVQKNFPRELFVFFRSEK